MEQNNNMKKYEELLEDLRVAKFDAAYHRKQMEYYELKIKILDEEIEGLLKY